jgi:pyruvate kinase
MHLLNKGQHLTLLKTKIVATVGKERSGPQAGRNDEICRPDGASVDNVLDHSELLSWLVKKGADVIRLNMSFTSDQQGGYGEIEERVLTWIRNNRNGLTRHVTVLGDLPGPKIRLKLTREYDLRTGSLEPFFLNFASDEDFPAEKQGAVVLISDHPFDDLAKVNGFANAERYVTDSIDKKQGAVFSIGDGKVILEALDAHNGIVKCKVTKGGRLKDRPGVTIKRADIEIPSLSGGDGLGQLLEQDKDALDFLLEKGADVVSYIGVSFVNHAKDILKVKLHVEKKLKQRYGHEAQRYAPAIIAKIETRKAWEQLDAILDVSDGVMVARGDLGLQLDPQRVPEIQKKIIRKCNLRGKPVITATQMLDSMETNTEPTRAEANDVFNAIQDGTDAVMLSGETSNGKYPAQAVEMMVLIAEQAESFYGEEHSGRAYKGHLQEVLKKSEELSQETSTRLGDAGAEAATKSFDLHLSANAREEYAWMAQLYAEKIERAQNQTITDSVSESACLLSEGKDYRDQKFKAIVAPTTSGRTARMISRFRPNVPIIGAAHDEANARKLIISFGVYPICIGEFPQNAGVEKVFDAARDEALKKGYVCETDFQLLEKGDMVISTSGTPLLKIGTTNLIQIRNVE